MDKEWRIPSLTRQDGEIVKVWTPREMDYERAEFLMKMFNERGLTANLKQGLQSADAIKLVIRNDRGSKSYNDNVYRMLSERPTIEANGSDYEFDEFLSQVDQQYSV